MHLASFLLLLSLAPQDADPPVHLRLAAFGDSTMAPREGVGQTWTRRLPALLAAHGVEVEVIDAAVGGSHSGRYAEGQRPRRPHALDRLDSAVRAHKPDVVVVQFGINDSWIDDADPKGSSRVPLEEYERNLGAIVDTLGADGARVILMTPNKIGGAHEIWRVRRLGKYSAAMRRVARGSGTELVDLWDAYACHERRSGEDRKTLMLDGMHPSDAGHALAADLLAEQLLKPLQRVDPSPVHIVVAGQTAVRGVERSPQCYAQFREGGVAVTSAGRLVVVAQGREKSSWSDRSGQDLVCRWSDDGGDTWAEAVLVVEHGEFSVCPNALVHDRERDALHMLYNVFEWDFRDAESRKKMKGRECRQFQVTSRDGGESWSAPRELTEMLGSDRHTTVFGSGEGIQLRRGEHAGRLVVPGGFQHRWGNRMFHSDDHGRTWTVGPVAPRTRVKELNVRLENKVAELSDGTLVLNARCTPHRIRAFSKDGGESWTPEEIDRGLAAVSCNGALLCVQDGAGRDVLLCSVPVGPKRTHGTIYMSFDGGRTWPRRKLLVRDEFAYSSLVQLADGRIALIYEARNHRDLDLLRFPLDWLVESSEMNDLD